MVPTLIVDTASLYFRAYFGVPTSLQDPRGRPVNAVYGLLDMLARLIVQYNPGGLVCAWDDDWRPRWRVDLVASYKAHRVASSPSGPQTEIVDDALAVQVPWIRACLEATGLRVVGAPGFEADDVLGTLSRRWGPQGRPVIVVTGDRDLFQLVGDHVRVAYAGRGVAHNELVDDSWLLAKYGVLGRQYADFATLRGDPSDGLPGVTGIGEKTAAGLLAAYGDLDGILAAALNPSSAMTASVRKRLTASVDYLQAARPVVATAEVPLPDLDPGIGQGRADLARCSRLAAEYGVRGPMGRLLAALGEPELPRPD
nr:5'-3' exonuclease [Brooklawnia cerclae]